MAGGPQGTPAWLGQWHAGVPLARDPSAGCVPSILGMVGGTGMGSVLGNSGWNWGSWPVSWVVGQCQSTWASARGSGLTPWKVGQYHQQVPAEQDGAGSGAAQMDLGWGWGWDEGGMGM